MTTQSSAPSRRSRLRLGPIERPIGQRWVTPYLFLIPGMLLFAVFVVWPASSAVQLAFYKYDIIDPPEFIGLANFERLLSSSEFWETFRNSLVYLVGMIPFTVVLPLLLAILVNRKMRAIHFFRTIYFLPVVTSMVAIAVAWNFVYDDLGVINGVLRTIGLIDEPIHFLTNHDTAQGALIFVEGWKGTGTYMMIFLAGLQSIPSDLYEAATVDGAGAWGRLRHVTLPLIRPFMAVALTLEMMGAMQIFTSVYMLTDGGPGNRTASLGYFIYQQAFEGHRMGYASAAALVMALFLVVLSTFNYRLGKKAED
ncbi:carbohydrate ABC transporter permease [Actinopolymorpha alba]|uniref:carbohydrate ABC transporter permease n=1 Tax=Actinopolymorpha alba TaxID=533267 RepID=UPI00035DC5C5|nr:sugar ABC transporter permease [Actinopolymorpha alba]